VKILKKIAIILAWLCLAVFVGFTIYYVYTQREVVKCQSVTVNINKNSPRFLDESEIVDLIEKSGEPVIGHYLAMINTHRLENKLSTYTTLDNVEIYRKVEARGFSFHGKLVVNVDERTPVVRIKNSNEDYYLDYKGIKIPVTSKYVDRIMIASGTVTDERIIMSLLKMADFVNKDDFWKAQIEQIFIQENGELLLLPQVGDYLIEFGVPDDFQVKFRNLKAVYQEGFKNIGWNKYKTISVKYRNQVVCTKK